MKHLLLIAPLLFCALPARAAISFISDCESATTGCTPATRAAGDLILTFAYKASLTAPAAPTGYTAITGCSASASVSSQNCACRIATNNASDAVAWTSTVGVVVVVYRGEKDTATCTNNFGGVANSTGASTTLTYPAITMSVTDGSSWLFGAAGQTTATNLSTNGTPAGVTQRVTSGANAVATGWDTNAGVSSDGSKTATITSANRWRSMQIEILAKPVGKLCAAFAGAGGTSAAIDMTGNTMLVFAVSADSTTPLTSANVSDSSSNTWTLIGADVSGSPRIHMFYTASTATVTNSQTFTVGGTVSSAAMCVMGFSGFTTVDQSTTSNSSGNNVTTQTTGSITPTQNNELLVTVIAGGSGETSYTSVTSPTFTIQSQIAFIGGNSYSCGLASLTQTSAAAANPTWNVTATSQQAAVIASFNPSGGGGGATAEQLNPRTTRGAGP